MAGTLFVVATPIGHLEDISARALRVLREASLVAAEDTRRTGNLLRHFGIPTPLVSLHEHNERARADQLIASLHRGQSVALVSDAGTPAISDPGAELVARARAEGIRVNAVPGANAVAAALSVAGLREGSFAFLGFPPVKSKDRKEWLAKARRLHQDVALVVFEAPHRIARTLKDLDGVVKRPIIVCRELTKLHEETVEGPAAELAMRFASAQGEFTVVVPAAEHAPVQQVTSDTAEVIAEFGRMTKEAPSSKRALAREVGRKFGLTTRQAYEIAKGLPK